MTVLLISISLLGRTTLALAAGRDARTRQRSLSVCETGSRGSGRRRRLRVLVVAAGILTLSALAAGCRHEEVGQERNRPIVVAVRNPHGGQDCHPRRVAQVVVAALDAINRGDEDLLDAIFPRSVFDWYAVGSDAGKRSSEIVDSSGQSNPYDRDNLLAYFGDRHERHEYLRLIELRVNHAEVKTELSDGQKIRPTLMAAVESRLLRSADDFQDSEPVQYHAKALIACRQHAVSMWSMGAEDEPLRLPPLCPEPTSRPPDAIVTC